MNLEEEKKFYPDQYSLSSKTSINDSIEINKNIEKNYVKIIEEKKYLICKKCKNAINIKFDIPIFNIKCNCSKVYNINLEYLRHFFLEKDKIEIKCQKHGKKFVCFCIDCMDNKFLNLCEECNEIHKNTYGNHDLIFFSKADDLIAKIEKTLKNKKFKKKYNYDYFQQIFELIHFLIENFKINPCYSYYKGIKNADKFLCKLYHAKKNKKYKIIKSLSDLQNYLSQGGNTDLIYSIIILGDKNDIEKKTFDLNCFANKSLSNLKKLVIKNVEIKNINTLLKKSLTQIENFTIEDCKFVGIDEINYDYLRFQKAKNLKYLSLYNDGIKNTKFLDLFNNKGLFSKLKTLYFGGNLFNEEEI